jgi:hypothetical protein
LNFVILKFQVETYASMHPFLFDFLDTSAWAFPKLCSHRVSLCLWVMCGPPEIALLVLFVRLFFFTSINIFCFQQFLCRTQ